MEDIKERERAVKGRCVIGSLARIMKARIASMEIKRVKEQYSPSNTDIPITELSIKKKKKASHIMYFNEGIYTR